MTKRKATTTTRSDWPPGKATKPPEPKKRINEVSLRCVWHTRVIVEPTRTLSGMRYEFAPGEVRSVRAIDDAALLALEKVQSVSCCGPGGSPVLKYFERA